MDPAILRRMPPEEIARHMRNGVAVVVADIEALLLDQTTMSERTVWAMDYSEVLTVYKADFLDLRRMHPSLDQHIKMLQGSNRGIAVKEKLAMKRMIAGESEVANAAARQVQLRKRKAKKSGRDDGEDEHAIDEEGASAVMAG